MRMRRISIVLLVLGVLVGVMAAAGAASNKGGVNRFEVTVVGNMRLPDGDIIFGGPIDLNEWFEGETVFAVTGGTEKFRNVSGDVRLILAEDLSYTTMVFRLKNSRASY